MTLVSAIERERVTTLPATDSDRRRRWLKLLAFTAVILSVVEASCTGSCEMSYETSEGSNATTKGPPLLPTATDITREQALKAYENFRAACLRNDAKALWELLDDGTRQNVENRAKEARDLGDGVLKNVIGYAGSLDEFTGIELVAATMARPEDLCDRASSWSVDPRGVRAGEYMLVVRRGEDAAMGIFLSQDSTQRLRVRPTAWAMP